MLLRVRTFIPLLCLSGPALVDASGSCVTHFYNNSDYEWSISGYDTGASPLVVSPHTTIDIPWGTSTEVTIGGNIPNRAYIKSFQVEAQQNCVTILHQGNTGNITLNKPGNGDVTTCAGGC